MADKPDDTKPVTPIERSSPRPPPGPRRDAGPDERPPARVAKIVEETGRYVCKAGITFTNDKGERAHARAGEVVSVAADDVKHLKKIGAIVEETREE